jgi:hypothetical protein
MKSGAPAPLRHVEAGGAPRVPPFGHANFWMRALLLSVTKTFPLPSTATPVEREPRLGAIHNS